MLFQDLADQRQAGAVDTEVDQRLGGVDDVGRDAQHLGDRVGEDPAQFRGDRGGRLLRRPEQRGPDPFGVLPQGVRVARRQHDQLPPAVGRLFGGGAVLLQHQVGVGARPRRRR